MTLEEEERRQHEARIREELEAEHQRREETARRKRERRRRSSQRPDAREAELNELRNQMRRKFYEERGYKLSHDPTGREVWLSPGEFELRDRGNRKKKGKKRPIVAPRSPARLRELLLFAAMCLAAVIVGLMLAR